jgi:hypothetical protein
MGKKYRYRFWHSSWDHPNDTAKETLDELERSLWRTSAGIFGFTLAMIVYGFLLHGFGWPPFVPNIGWSIVLVGGTVGVLVYLSRKADQER